MHEVQSMKRPLLFLSALLLAVVFVFPVHARAEEEVVSIQVGTVSGENGALVDLPVLLDNCTGVDSVQFDLNYDSAALQFISMAPGDLFAAQYTIANSDVPGRVRIACASALGLGEAGTLLTLRFRLLSETGSAVSITSGIVTRVDADYNQTKSYVAIQDGGVSAGTAPLPAPAVTPWVPATPVPTPSPTPEVTATPEATATPEEASASPETVTPPATGLSASVYYVGGGLLFAVILLVVILLVRKNKNG
jgi:hypothetical protein